MTATTNQPRPDRPTYAAHAAGSPRAAPSTERGSSTTTAAVVRALSGARDATAAGLTETTGLGRSTVTKVLAGLAERGQAIRTPGGRDGKHRLPDRWNLPDTTPDTAPRATDEPDDATDPDNAAGAPDSADDGSADVDAATGRVLHAVPDLPDFSPATGHGLRAVPDTLTVATEPDGDEHAEDVPADRDTMEASAAAEAADLNNDEPTRDTPVAVEDPKLRSRDTAGQSKGQAHPRLGRGQLRAQAHAHLVAHPEVDFTPHEIGRVLDRSAGAVANALAKLTANGETVQTSDRPRRYRLAQEQKDTP